MGQAGIGTIDQAKVSNNSPVPQNTVIAQPKMLLLFFDHNFNRPTFEVIPNHLFNGKTYIIGYQRDYSPITSPFREDNLDKVQLVHGSNALREFIAGCFPEPLNTVPPTRTIQKVLTIRTHLMFRSVGCQPTIGLADTDIPPLPLFDHSGAEIERIEQDGHVELIRNLCIMNDIFGQSSQFLEAEIKLFGVFFFDVQPGAKRNRHTSVPETCLDNVMSVTIFSGGMMMDLSDSLHLLGPLNGLSVVDDEQALFASLLIEPSEHTPCLVGDHIHLVKLTSPQEFAMIRSVRGVPQQLYEPVNGRSVADADCYDERTIIGVHVGSYPAFDRLEKICCFFLGFYR